ncbi:cysteine desulfurase [Ichthyobacterium seriolicida]|uniref:cysteine desulfurase n=2 Tax=Ichthyobacterium seriolicida TaxID=242600 RepID=A0A1J1EC69_9FLAO|nr:cysteine desulfurase [Ichthyobacterium seriolicida]
MSIHDLGVKRIITSTIEHSSVKYVVERVKNLYDIEVVYLNLDKYGNVDLNHLEESLKEKNTKTLVSLMHSNNEIGNLLDLNMVSELCSKHGALLHSDTIQSIGHYNFDLSELNIDFITCSAHKIHGPKGVGFIYINNTNNVKSVLCGGSQERGKRGGTENLFGIVGLGKAIEIAYLNLDEHRRHIEDIKLYMIKELKKNIEGIGFNGESANMKKSLYTLLNVMLPPKKIGMLQFSLDIKGIASSSGSACCSGASSPYYVLDSLGLNLENRTSVRFSFSKFSLREEIDYVIEVLKEIYK